VYLLAYATAANPLAGVFGSVVFRDAVVFSAAARGLRAFAGFFASVMDLI